MEGSFLPANVIRGGRLWRLARYSLALWRGRSLEDDMARSMTDAATIMIPNKIFTPRNDRPLLRKTGCEIDEKK